MRKAKRIFLTNERRTQQFQMARTMLILVTVFLILNTPRLILGIVEVTQLSTVEQCYQHGLPYNISKHTYLLDFLARFLVILNSSINFIIYILVGSEFRSKLCDTIRFCDKLCDPLRGLQRPKYGAQEKSECDVDDNEEALIDKTSVTRIGGELPSHVNNISVLQSDSSYKVDSSHNSKHVLIETHF
jgi:hypothetical protein